MTDGCKIIILGPPGAGKGTQARVVAEGLGIPHIDCGRVVRAEVDAGSEFGDQAKEHMIAGRLVPDSLIIGMMLHRLSEDDAKDGFLLDGFPRTVNQATGLDSFLAGKDSKLDNVILLDLDDETIVRRLGSRRYCPACGRVFNIDTLPPKVEGKCDSCGGGLAQRPDDHPETVVERLKVYAAETAPLKEHYGNSDGYLVVDGDGDADSVTESILSATNACREK